LRAGRADVGDSIDTATDIGSSLSSRLSRDVDVGDVSTTAPLRQSDGTQLFDPDGGRTRAPSELDVGDVDVDTTRATASVDTDASTDISGIRVEDAGDIASQIDDIDDVASVRPDPTTGDASPFDDVLNRPGVDRSDVDADTDTDRDISGIRVDDSGDIAGQIDEIDNIDSLRPDPRASRRSPFDDPLNRPAVDRSDVDETPTTSPVDTGTEVGDTLGGRRTGFGPDLDQTQANPRFATTIDLRRADDVERIPTRDAREAFTDGDLRAQLAVQRGDLDEAVDDIDRRVPDRDRGGVTPVFSGGDGGESFTTEPTPTTTTRTDPVGDVTTGFEKRDREDLGFTTGFGDVDTTPSDFQEERDREDAFGFAPAGEADLGVGGGVDEAPRTDVETGMGVDQPTTQLPEQNTNTRIDGRTDTGIDTAIRTDIEVDTGVPRTPRRDPPDRPEPLPFEDESVDTSEVGFEQDILKFDVDTLTEISDDITEGL
jgi:hypothetical protein